MVNKFETGLTLPPEHTTAREAFRPTNFGFRDLKLEGRIGWEKDVPSIGTLVFTPLNRGHLQLEGLSKLISHMQTDAFNLNDPLHVIPPHLIGIPQYIIAHKKDQLTEAGCVGFSIAFGGQSRDTILSSKAVGVVNEYQGKADIGWDLRVLQAHYALENNYDGIEYFYNPNNGRNARLFLTKLGGVGTFFAPQKAGFLDTSKGMPSDKVGVTWDLLSPTVHRKLNDVYKATQNNGRYQGLTIANLDIPVTMATADNIQKIKQTNPDIVLYEIPAEISELDPHAKSHWEKDLNVVFQELLETEQAILLPNAHNDLASVSVRRIPGNYIIDDLITDFDDKGKVTKNIYVLRRKQKNQAF